MCTLDTFAHNCITLLIYTNQPQRTPHTAHATPHSTAHSTHPMIGKGGKGYYVGGQDREWLSCLKSHLQQHKPNNASPNDTSHHIPPTTHHTPHSPKFDVRQARGGKAKGLLATPGGDRRQDQRCLVPTSVHSRQLCIVFFSIYEYGTYILY